MKEMAGRVFVRCGGCKHVSGLRSLPLGPLATADATCRLFCPKCGAGHHYTRSDFLAGENAGSRADERLRRRGAIGHQA